MQKLCISVPRIRCVHLYLNRQALGRLRDALSLFQSQTGSSCSKMAGGLNMRCDLLRISSQMFLIFLQM